MPDDIAIEILRRDELMRNERSQWEQTWQDQADLMLPREGTFQARPAGGSGAATGGGDRRDKRIVDGTGVRALPMYASILESALTPRSMRWHSLTGPIGDQSSRAWYEGATDALFAARYDPRANFASAIREAFLSVGAFGTLCFYVDDDLDRGAIRYRTISLMEVAVAEDAGGLIDTVHRYYELTARQAVQRFGEATPEKIRTTAEKTPFQRFPFVHAVMPAEELGEGKPDEWRKQPHASVHVAVNERMTIKRSGFRTMPFMVARADKAPREVYGRGPGWEALPDLRQLQIVSADTTQGLRKAVDPPLLATEDWRQGEASLESAAVNFGGLSPDGKETIRPMDLRTKPELGFAFAEKLQEAVKESFMLHLWAVLQQQRPQQTATESSIEDGQRAELLAPVMGRLQTELLAPMIARELDILADKGLLPEPPKALAEKGAPYEVVYETPMAKLQRAQKGQSILRAMGAIAPLAQMRPDVMDRFDLDGMAVEIARSMGVPGDLVLDDDKVEALRQQRQQATEAAQAVEAAPKVAGAVRQLSEVKAA